MPERCKPQGEEGAVLLLALIFMAIFGLTLGALLPQISTGLSNSAVVRDFDARTYVADSSLDFALQQLRWDTTLCPDVGSGTQTVPVPTVDARVSSSPVTVTCQTEAGSVNGTGGYAVVTTGSDTANSLQASAGGQKQIDGPVWTNGIDPGHVSKLEVSANMQVSAASEPCHSQGPGPLPSGSYGGPNALTLDAPYTISCFPAGTQAPTPTVTPPDKSQLAAVSNSGGSALPSLNLGSCKVYSPGVYSAPPADANGVYLQSGVYWFDNVNWTINGSSVVGGEPGPGDAASLGPSGQACSSDVDPALTGRGVTIVLAGASSITLNSGSLELFGRSGGASWEGTQGISIETASGWSGSGPALNITSGSTVQAVVHGVIFAPNAPILLGATAAPVASAAGGVVAQSLTVSRASCSSCDGSMVSVHNGSGYRRMLVTATVKGQGGNRDVVATAVVDLSNDSSQSLTVESRRNGGFSGTS